MISYVRRSALGWSARVAALVCGAGLGLNAAAYEGVSASYGGLLSKVNASKVTASETISAAQGSAKAVGRVSFTGPGGAAVAGDLSVAVSRRSALAIAGRALGSVVPLVAGAMLAYDVYQNIRVASTGAGLSQDIGLATEAVTSWRSYAATSIGNSAHPMPAAFAETQLGAVQAAYALLAAAAPNWGCAGGGVGCWEFRIDYCDAVGCSIARRNRYDPGTAWSPWIGEGYFAGEAAGVQQLCPKIPDPANPGGTYRPGKNLDGRCKGGDVIAIQPDAAAGLVEALPNSFAGGLDYPRLLRESVPFAVPADAEQEVVLPSVEPAHLDGPEVNTTAPSGITTRDKTEYDVKAREANDLPNSARWRETHTYTYIDPQGNETPGGTTTTSPGGAAGEDVPDLCALHPEIVACAKVGEAPHEDTPKRSAALSWAAEAISLPSGCPSAVTMADGIVVEYTQICDAATRARPFVLVGAAFSALMLVVATLRGG